MFINILLAIMLTASTQCAIGGGRDEDPKREAEEYLCFCTGEYVTSPGECECAQPADDGL